MPKVSADAEWTTSAKNLIRSELTRKGVTYAQLSEMLDAIGVQENEKNVANKIGRNVANKIGRGTFSMAFFMQCMKAIGVSEVRL